MEVIKDERLSHKQLVIVERFEVFMNYTYPIAMNIPRAHHVLRDRFIHCLFAQVAMFYQAAKSSQVSKLYIADAGIADLKFLLRFLAEGKRRFISQHQHQVAQSHLAEVGSMLGAWIRDRAAKG